MPIFKTLFCYKDVVHLTHEVITASGIIFVYMIIMFNIHMILFYKT